MKNNLKSAIFGLAVGDALGVPVEFNSRESLSNNPVVGMRSFGSHHQPAGTWSDDSSLTFCLMESLCNGYDLKDMAQKFVAWKHNNYWTPRGQVFDIGIATSQAIRNISRGFLPEACGGVNESDNGNGSLMRILPLAFYLQNEENLDVVYRKIMDVSSITHGHFRSVYSCFIYIVYAIELIKGCDKWEAYQNMKTKVNGFSDEFQFNPSERKLFDRVLNSEIQEEKEESIRSQGYVLYSLEASFWCLLTCNSYKETVLKAVNLGHDTDTTGAIAGGLAGIYYGFESIPADWVDVLARKNDIEDLIIRFEKSVNQ